MFTGIVETTTTVTALATTAANHAKLSLATPSSFVGSIKLGDSIAVNGCCLTLASLGAETIEFDVSSETLAKTNIGDLSVGDRVNTERAMLAGARLDGHIVSGHIDGQASLFKVDKHDSGWLLVVDIPGAYASQVIVKGSICLDGVSLTINNISDLGGLCRLSMMLIPTTLQLTNLGSRRPGARLNFETDIIGKYLERMSQAHPQLNSTRRG